MKKIINKRFVKISSRIEIPPEMKIELGKDYILALKACAVKEEVGDQQDGTVDVVHKLKPIEVQIDN